jgi:hypothetical protein
MSKDTAYASGCAAPIFIVLLWGFVFLIILLRSL